VREAASLNGALDAELWASAMLGVLWTRRFALEPEDYSKGWAVVLGEPLIRRSLTLAGSALASPCG
jgi:hypothetical protein